MDLAFVIKQQQIIQDLEKSTDFFKFFFGEFCERK
jgi:hypothetical protein